MYLYEDAIIQNINKLFTNSKVCAVVADSLNEGLRRIAAKEEDKITLPAIVIVGGNWQIDDINFYSLMHGSEYKKVDFNDSESVVKTTSIIPFTPSYDMYIMAQSSRECDMLTRELIFHYCKNPTLLVKVPYGINEEHTFNLVFSNNITKYQNPSGLVYRQLGFKIQGAYLWHNDTFNMAKNIEYTVTEEYEQNV